MKISLSLLGILTLMSTCQGLSLRRSERVEKISDFENIHDIGSNPNSTATEIDFLTTKAAERRNLNILPSIMEELTIPIEEDVDLIKIINEDVPKNIILLFIQEYGNNDAIWRDLEKSSIFSVRRNLQNCQNERNFAKFPLEDSMNLEESQCNCEKFLQTNVDSLLNWAQRAKIASANIETREKLKRILEKYAKLSSSISSYAIPSSLEEDMSILRKELFEKPSELEADWHLIDLNKGKFFPFSDIISMLDDDELWDFFQRFSTIRIACFKKWWSLLYNKNEKIEKFEANLLQLIKDTVTKSKSLPYDKGFILIAFSPGNQLLPAIDFLKETVSGKDTLLLVSGTCSHEKRGVPFFAHGPGSKYFYEANSISDLPTLLKRASNCDGFWCKTQSFNANSDLRRKMFKRTAKNEQVKTMMESSTKKNTASVDVINNTTVDSVEKTIAAITNATLKNEINNTISQNISAVNVTLSTEVPVVPLNNSVLENSTTVNNFTITISNLSNINDTISQNISTPNLTLSTEVPVVPLNNSVLENSTTENNFTIAISNLSNINDAELKNSSTINNLKNTTEMKNLTTDENRAMDINTNETETNVTHSTMSSIVNNVKITTEKKLSTDKKIEETIKTVDSRIYQDTNEEISKNSTKNVGTEEINADSEASGLSKQTTTVIISVATSFAALLLFHS